MQNLSYTFDANGNITGITNNLNSAKNKTYTYDALDRLTAGTGPWGSLSWTYDGVGNRLTQNDSTGTKTYTYQNGTNKLTGITGASSSFTFDANGNTITENSRDYIYNQNQRLIRVSEAGSTRGDYVYNENGQRISKTVTGTPTIFHYDRDGQLIAESSSSGSTQTEYVYLNGEPITKMTTTATTFIHTDHLGTPVLMTDATAATIWEIEARPFGDSATITGAGSLNLRFPGQYFDAETGLHQNWHRDYVPSLGRYLESDPLGIDEGKNYMYSYANCKPLNYIDADGLSVATCCGMTSKLPKQEVMTGLECMSKCLKTTILISSGWRDEKENKAADGVENSYHLKGLAADVHQPPSQTKLRRAAAECNLTVLAKKYPNRIHVEVRNGNQPKKDPDECVCKKIRESGGSTGTW